MTTPDPYAAPLAAGGGSVAPDVPQGAVEALRGTRPWVRLFSILGFFSAALMVAIGAVVILGGGASMFGGFGGDGAAAVGMMIALGAFYVLIGLLYFLPCLYLFRYASRITRITEGGGAAALVDALDQQRRFWRLVGIYTVAMLALYAVGLVVFAIVAATGALGGFGS
jgi:glycerol-3-phosphate acyltransferase PlsY